ncbi:MAG: hypothetical protein ACTSXQ_06200 [Alphaproteobacteria bacterium]
MNQDFIKNLKRHTESTGDAEENIESINAVKEIGSKFSAMPDDDKMSINISYQNDNGVHNLQYKMSSQSEGMLFNLEASIKYYPNGGFSFKDKVESEGGGLAKIALAPRSLSVTYDADQKIFYYERRDKDGYITTKASYDPCTDQVDFLDEEPVEEPVEEPNIEDHIDNLEKQLGKFLGPNAFKNQSPEEVKNAIYNCLQFSEKALDQYAEPTTLPGMELYFDVSKNGNVLPDGAKESAAMTKQHFFERCL